MNDRAVSKINETLLHIYRLIPDATDGDRTRTTRALLDIVGKISRSLFGTATVDEVQKLERAMTHLHNQRRQLVNVWQKASARISSFGKAVNSRVDGLREMIDSQHQATEQLFTEVYGQMADMTKSSSQIATALGRFENFVLLLHDLTAVKVDLELLAQGMLSPNLITPPEVHHTIRQVMTELSNLQDVNLYLLRQAVKDFYSLHNFIFSRKGSNIYIHVQLPVGPFAEFLTLFEVHILPVPTPGSPGHETRLVNLPKFLAYHPLLRHYMQFDQRPNIDKNKLLYLDKDLELLKKKTHPLCLIAILQNQTNQVHHLCQFAVLTDSLKPRI